MCTGLEQLVESWRLDGGKEVIIVLCVRIFSSFYFDVVLVSYAKQCVPSTKPWTSTGYPGCGQWGWCRVLQSPVSTPRAARPRYRFSAWLIGLPHVLAN